MLHEVLADMKTFLFFILMLAALSEYELFKNLTLFIVYFIFYLKTLKIFSGTSLVDEETLMTSSSCEVTTPRPRYIFDTRPLVNYMIDYVKKNWKKFVVYPMTPTTTTAK